MIASRNFSVGELHGWHGVLLGLVGSTVFLIGGWQDLKPPASIGAAFWFFLALLFTGGAIGLGIGARIWVGALLGVASLCLEVRLIHRWWRRAQFS